MIVTVCSIYCHAETIIILGFEQQTVFQYSMHVHYYVIFSLILSLLILSYTYSQTIFLALMKLRCMKVHIAIKYTLWRVRLSMV